MKRLLFAIWVCLIKRQTGVKEISDPYIRRAYRYFKKGYSPKKASELLMIHKYLNRSVD